MTGFVAKAAVAATVLGLAGVAEAKDPVEPATGVAFQPRRGWFAETQIGVFTAMGGLKTFSNAQPFVALSLGLDLESVAPNLSAFFTVAHGYNAASCRDVTEGRNGPACTTFKLPDNSDAAAPDNFSVIPAEVGVRYGFPEFMPRLSAAATATLGYSVLTPQIFKDAPLGSAHVGVGGGVSYATRLPGLDVGAEVLVRVAFSPMLPSLSAYPRIRYVF